MQFTEDVIAELAALAPGNYIHIGGDEAIGLPHDKFVNSIEPAYRVDTFADIQSANDAVQTSHY